MQDGVSAIIPTYNRAELLGEAIDSISSQDVERVEIVIVDDGSTDNTSSVIARRQLKSKHPIKVIRQANAGESAARNAGILGATYETVAFLDSDNRWRQGKLREQLAFMRENSYDFTFTAYVEFGSATANSRVLRVDNWQDDSVLALRRLLIGCLVNTSTVIAHRDVLVDAGLFDPTLRCCADHDLWLKIAAKGNRFGYLDKSLTDYRIHEGSVSQESALVARSTEVVMERLFQGGELPNEIGAEASIHLARCYLNSACRYMEARQPHEARRALWTALCRRPASARPGWLRILVHSLLMAEGKHSN